jgi:hypothetical protein
MYLLLALGGMHMRIFNIFNIGGLGTQARRQVIEASEAGLRDKLARPER